MLQRSLSSLSSSCVSIISLSSFLHGREGVSPWRIQLVTLLATVTRWPTKDNMTSGSSILGLVNQLHSMEHSFTQILMEVKCHPRLSCACRSFKSTNSIVFSENICYHHLLILDFRLRWNWARWLTPTYFCFWRLPRVVDTAANDISATFTRRKVIIRSWE